MTTPSPRPWVERDVNYWRNGIASHKHDAVAVEAPVLMAYNGESHAVMLATPQDLDDFAIGFSLSENIIDRADDITALTLHDHPEGIAAMMTISSTLAERRAGRERLMTGRTGCGLCGVRTLEQAIRYPQPVTSSTTITTEILHRALEAMGEQQKINIQTGSTHAAAWADTKGSIQILREDIGRHNALDKLIGAMARGAIDTTNGFAIVTSRASYEMVQKTAAANIGLLAAVSAPTSLAIRLAEMSQLTLIGFARPSAHTIYTHPYRLLT